MGLNSSLSSLTSAQVCQKGGGGQSQCSLGNRPLLSDYGLIRVSLSKLNFYKLIPYPMDTQDPPTNPAISLLGV